MDRVEVRELIGSKSTVSQFPEPPQPRKPLANKDETTVYDSEETSE